MTALFSRYALAIVWRHSLVWRSMLGSSIASNVVNPTLFLFAFGFGLGAFIDTMDGVDYLAFIVPGMIAYSAMFSASFENTIGSYSRYAMHRTWDAMLATPVSLFELLWGEVLWSALKAFFAAVCVLIVGWIWGGVISISGAMLTMPVVFIASLGFASYGLFATSCARGYEFFSYFFTFWITPMFVFSGVFFEIDRFPATVQWLAWLLPMTHLVAVIRPWMTEMPISPLMVLVHLTYLIGLGVLAFWLAYRNIRKRMFD